MITVGNLTRRSEEQFDKSSSILIVGKGESSYKNNEIVQASYVEQVEYAYGEDSDLTNAFKEAYSLGIRNIFLCNCYNYNDYIKALNVIAYDEYAYITPLFNMSDTIIDNNTEYFLAEVYSNVLGDKLTQIIVTEKHASYYEDINHYILNMNKIGMNFKAKTTNNLDYGDNLCFVLNNLKKYNFANVALASILLQNDFKYYPQANIGDVVYDLNNNDLLGQEIVYFAYDSISGTTIENFLNYCPTICPEKYVPVNIVKQIICRALDFSKYSGSLYNAYLKIRLENQVNSIMSSFTGKLIESYSLLDIKAIPTDDHRIIIYIFLSIKPYNSIESIEIALEV